MAIPSPLVMARLELSRLVSHQIAKPSPIRQIMKMADRKNIISMGLDPEKFISFAGGWVNHRAPESLRQKYIEICSDMERFHKSGGYSTTIGEGECREQIAFFEGKIFGMKNISAENIIVGQSSTQLAHDVLRTLANPGESVLLLDPTYANYIGQMIFSLTDIKIEVSPGGIEQRVPGAEIVYLPVLDNESWKCFANLPEIFKEMRRIFDLQKPKIVLFPSPDNPTSQIPSERFVKELLEQCQEAGSYLLIDHAYKTQYFGDLPKYYSWSPEDYPNLVTLHSNSKWGRGLGRRMGWLEANKEVIEGMERVQQCSILCPDSLHQMAFASYMEEALKDGSLKKYLEEARNAYKKAADVTIEAIDDHLGLKRTVPQGGLYTVVDVGQDSDSFVLDVMKNTGVLFVPGSGFGKTLKNGIRISYGPLVDNIERIKEGLERVGDFLGKRKETV